MHPLYHRKKLCCCGSATCAVCRTPDLICPRTSGVTATFTGVELADELFTVTGDPLGDVAWSGPLSSGGSICLRNYDGCGYDFVSKYPVATASVTIGGEDAIETDFYLRLVFECAALVVTAIVQARVSSPNGESGIVTLFSTNLDSGTGTGAASTAWPRTCGTSGYALYNQLGEFGDQATGDDYGAGINGSLTTGGTCSSVSCLTGCPDTSLMLSVSGPGVSFSTVMTGGGAPTNGCGYVFDDGRYHGTLGPETDGYGLTIFRLVVRDRTLSGDPVVAGGYRVCTGDAGSNKGEYEGVAEGQTITVS